MLVSSHKFIIVTHYSKLRRIACTRPCATDFSIHCAYHSRRKDPQIPL